MKQAIVNAEKQAEEARAAREEEERLQDLEDAKAKKKPQKKKKGEEDEDEFAVDYDAIRKSFEEPDSEKIIIELLISQGVQQEFFELFFQFVVEIQKQAKEQDVKLVIMNSFTVYGRKDILDAQSK
jgi:hypothetical protein